MHYTTAHSAHDETLIVRFFGDDVDESGRALAGRLVAECEDCGELFADLGSIASATRELPVPPRPRDFSMSEADAARLRPKRSRLGRLLGLGARRSFGGTLVAVGFAGLLLSGTLSMGGAATTQSLDAGARAPEANSDASPNDYAKGAGAVAAASLAPTAAPATSAQVAASSASLDGGTAETATSSPTPADMVPGNGSATSGGPDVRAMALLVSGVVLSFGFAVLLVPPLLRRRSRG
jgi:hypothetical protein